MFAERSRRAEEPPRRPRAPRGMAAPGVSCDAFRQGLLAVPSAVAGDLLTNVLIPLHQYCSGRRHAPTHT